VEWRSIESALDPEWEVATLAFVPEAGAINAAAGVLAPLGPGRLANELRIQVRRGGADVDRLENLLGRLDRKRVWGELRLIDARLAEPAPAAVPASTATAAPASLAAQWAEEIAKLPPGWRDASGEIEFESTDFLAQAALVGSPLNPSRVPGRIALRFRVVDRGVGGYGTSPEMARRCFERMDAAEVRGRLLPLRAVSDVDYVYTQGPVWREEGRAV
jgi:hypothetical protein